MHGPDIPHTTGSYTYYVDNIRFEWPSMVVQNTGHYNDVLSGVSEIEVLPNPVNTRVRIELNLENGTMNTQNMRVQIFDMRGSMIYALSSEQASFKNSAVWDTRDFSGYRVPSGLYLVRAIVGERTLKRTIAVVR
jgi:hypothetical protein